MGVFTIASTCITNYPEISPEKKDVGNRILSLIMKFQSKYAIKIINPGDTNTNLGKKVLQQLIPFLNTVVNIVYDSDTVQDYTLFYLKFKDKGIPLPNEFINKLKILNPVSRYIIHIIYVSDIEGSTNFRRRCFYIISITIRKILIRLGVNNGPLIFYYYYYFIEYF